MSERLLIPVTDDRAEYAALNDHLTYSAMRTWAQWVKRSIPSHTISSRQWHRLAAADGGTPYLARLHHIGTTIFKTDTQTVDMRRAGEEFPLVTMRGRQHGIKHAINELPVVGEWNYLAGPLGLAWATKVIGSGDYSLIATGGNFNTTHNPSIIDVQLQPGGDPEADIVLAKTHLIAAHACMVLSMADMNAAA
jgi:hypothetical protein